MHVQYVHMHSHLCHCKRKSDTVNVGTGWTAELRQHWEYVSVLLSPTVWGEADVTLDVFSQSLVACLSVQHRGGMDFVMGKALGWWMCWPATNTLLVQEHKRHSLLSAGLLCLHRHVSMWRNAGLSRDPAIARQTELCHVVSKPV